MMGMPKQSEVAHAEGVPGDYGIHPVFPHGGKYLLALRVSPPGGEAFTAEFPLDVKDGDPNRPPRPKPFELVVGVKPSSLRWRAKSQLTFTVKDRVATGYRVRRRAEAPSPDDHREDLGVCGTSILSSGRTASSRSIMCSRPMAVTDCSPTSRRAAARRWFLAS
jgi:hypothetical protein